MKTYGVLVVDDSALMRKSISALVETHPQFYVIGKARNGVDALEKIQLLKPDVVTIDLEMPEMNGLQVIQEMMKHNPLPIIVIANNADDERLALSYGAGAFILKKYLWEQESIVQNAFFHTCLEHVVLMKLPKQIVIPKKVERIMELPNVDTTIKLVVIGSSTGGPAALQRILSEMAADFPVPVFIVQHMPPGFTKSLAQRFDKNCAVHVKEAEHSEVLQAGTVYIAPAGIQASLRRNEEGQIIVRLHQETNIETLYCPSIDVALLSITANLQHELLSVILTGMGDDGLRGCREVKQNGGRVIVETEESCVVYGMPKVVANAGYADRQVSILQVLDAIEGEVEVKCKKE